MTASNLLEAYDSIVGVYRALTSQTSALIAQLIAESTVNPHSITSRVKERDSLESKLNRHIPPYSSLEEITDIGGIRITTYFADDVDVIAKLIAENFDVDIENSIDKRLALDPDRFGYLSVHYVVSLNEVRGKLPEYSRFTGMKLEIQVRSILQHAWAEMEHDIGYKSVSAVPRHLRRQFARLSGILELADEQFSKIRDELIMYRENVESRIASDPSAVSLNQDSLERYVATSARLKELDNEIATRMGFVFRDYESEQIDEDAERFSKIGFDTIGQLDESLAKNYDNVIKFTDFRATEGKYDGEWVERGIALFYLWQYLVAATQDVQYVKNMFTEFRIGSRDDARRSHQIDRE